MKRLYLLFYSSFFLFSVNAQDAYHTDLQNLLQTDFGLPTADWVFFDNENAIINDASGYGSSATNLNVMGQLFSRKVRHVVGGNAGAPWDAAWLIRNNVAVQAGDIMLAVFYLRSEGGTGKVNFFVEHATTYEKEVILTLPVGEEWRRYMVSFESGSGYGVDGLSWGFHLAFQQQTIEIGGFTALNYDNDVELDDLPNELNNEFYDGWEADAPWRAAAAERIDELRKADLKINVKDTNGNPVENAGVNVNMLQHEFAFGTAITASRLPGGGEDNVIYYNKLLDLDGEGHGFNWVVFENDLKWDAWEEEWFVNKTELVNGVQWLVDNDLKIRGHNLVWPGSSWLPDDIPNNLDNPSYIKDRIDGHLDEILNYNGLQGNIAEWDVLNEIAENRTLENAFSGTPGYSTGRELYQEIFEEARTIDPNIGLWLNDYVTLTLNNSAGSEQYDRLKQFTGELVNSGVDIEGIGFQGHIGGFPNGIPSVLATYDDFYNSFGLKAKVTEFDTPSFVEEELGATYLRDFMTATFSHPSMNGFLFWNFWDGATWLNGGSNLFRMDWSATPARDAFVDLLFDEWWTEETVSTLASGEANTRVFKGLYEISYECDGVMVRDTLNIVEASEYAIVCDNISTDINEIKDGNGFNIFPNPTSGDLHIQRNSNEWAEINLFDLSGKSILQKKSNSELVTLNVEQLKGMYILEIRNDENEFFKKIIVE